LNILLLIQYDSLHCNIPAIRSENNFVQHKIKAQQAQMLEQVQTLIGHKNRVWHAAWNPRYKILATCGADISVRLWQYNSNNVFSCVEVVSGQHSRTIRWIDWHPSGDMFACASFDGTTSIWKRDFKSQSLSFSCVTSIEGHENEVKSVSWDSTGKYLATCGRDKAVWIWEMQNYDGFDAKNANNNNNDADLVNEDGDVFDAVEFECVSICQGHSQDVKMVKWHPVEPILASASYDDTVKLWREDLDDWNCFETLKAHSSTVWSCDFAPAQLLTSTAHKDLLVSCSDDNSVIFWQKPQTQQQQQQDNNSSTSSYSSSIKPLHTVTAAHDRTVYSCSWSRYNNLIATGAGDDSIQIFDNNAKSIQKITNAHEADVNCVQWNSHPSHGNLLASTSDDGTIKIWQWTK